MHILNVITSFLLEHISNIFMHLHGLQRQIKLYKSIIYMNHHCTFHLHDVPIIRHPLHISGFSCLRYQHDLQLRNGVRARK